MQLSAESEAALKVSKKQEIAKRDSEIAAIEIKIDALRKPKPVLVELRPVEQK
jgi:hypothetical protein